MTDDEPTAFRARPRRDRDGFDRRDQLLVELERLRSRFARAAQHGRRVFTAPDSDEFDIGMLAVINLADLVSRQLPPEVDTVLPPRSLDGLRATRNIAAHNYGAMDSIRLWETVSVHGPALIEDIETAISRM